ncbi:MAG: hypothetical protein M0Q26_00975 [Chitinophagaceae bacterium]|nr:hypothetical protein [Chitinophagaceae bacterium]MDP1810511.1 hypothetical protein [Sediminibacterium sp.]MDP3129582.1 hypothetical protein [Sediminibacterium sp.]
MSHKQNLNRIKGVYKALGPMQKKVVFVGGATISLYMDKISEEVRPTDDVDILVEVVTYAKLAEVEEQLRSMGFQNDIYAKHAHRYIIQGIVVDLMPTGKNVTGVSNIWYADGYNNAIDFAVDEWTTVKIFSAPYFIATKLEAFKSPARKYNNDGRNSRDFEDIIFVLENRRAIWGDFENADLPLKDYLKNEFKRLMAIPYFEEWLDGHAGLGSPPLSYMILRKLKEFVG